MEVEREGRAGFLALPYYDKALAFVAGKTVFGKIQIHDLLELL